MQISSLPIKRPMTLAADLTAAEIVDVDFSLYDLFAAASRAGKNLVQGKVIRGCRIQGPGVLLAGAGVTFTDCNFGDSRGGIANLLLRAIGGKAIGATPLRDVKFVSCEFYGVGFTGPEEFLQAMLKVSTGPGTPQ